MESVAAMCDLKKKRSRRSNRLNWFHNGQIGVSLELHMDIMRVERMPFSVGVVQGLFYATAQLWNPGPKPRYEKR